ncbi:MAG TPA: TonB-dependent receptor plug domain-containing protein [Bryobacteraceae bacterium]|nr:TonB-dependent receptor plug domain-containing protein [Bryobacteraceae bacterium]
MLLTLSLLIWLAAACAAQEQDDNAVDPPKLPVLYQSVVITATPVEPQFDRRNSEVFRQTLFSRDDQVFHVLGAGIDAGQHEGGGKSIEVRRFGFNLDHGGVNGGLKVLVDDVQQNQTTQGHGQGYLGSLKTLTPELVEEVDIINGPFSAEYGDFSGLGVVHIRQREELPDVWTARVQGGSFGQRRGFVAFSPELRGASAFAAYEGAMTDGPFVNPLRYRRDNVTANYTRRLAPGRSLGFKFNGGRNDFDSSGQVPLDEVAAGRLDPFGYVDPTDGGRARAATAGVYYLAERERGAVLRVDGHASRSLLDLFSNFTFFLNNPETGDAFQQHDSRLQQGANAQYLAPHRVGSATALAAVGVNFHADQILVGLYPRAGRVPTGVTALAHADIANAAGYVQESLSLLAGRLAIGAGLRYDVFRTQVEDRVHAGQVEKASGSAQPKANVAYTPSRRWPATLYANYGRGISSTDARSLVRSPRGRQLATTDFYQAGTSHAFRHFTLVTDAFWIDRSNELVYVADDDTLEFAGPSRAYGFEAKVSFELTRKLSLDGGLTKVANAYYRGTSPRVYVDRAPHLAANAGLTLAGWRGWSGSLRMRAINHYRLDGEDAAVVAAGNTVFDLSMSRRIRRGLDANIAVDNLTNRLYYETQNYFVSRLPGQAPVARIHATPGYPRTFSAGLTVRFGGK